MISWWKGEGNANDSFGANNGALQGSLSYAPGEVGSAFSFPVNTQGAVHVPNISGRLDVGAGPGFTIEGWINPTELNFRPIFEWNSGSAFGVHVWSGVSGTDDLSANIVDTEGAYHFVQTSSGVLQVNLPQHVALTYDKNSGNAIIYVNGIQAGQSSIGSVRAQTTYDLYLGARVSDSQRWEGLIDEVSLYSRTLTPDEIWAIYSASWLGKSCVNCACVAPPSGMVGWWRGEDSTSDSGGSDNGVAYGGVSYVGGEVSDAFHMNGTDAYVRVPDSSGNLNVGTGGGFTVEGWIRNSDATGRPIVEWNNGSAFGVHLWANFPTAGALFANVVGTSGANYTFNSSGGLLGIGLLHHVALTYDKTTGNAIIYLDGAQVALQSIGNITPQTTYDLYLGARVSSGDRWAGDLDEMTVYSRALSASEIAAIYYALGSGKCHY